MVFLVYFFFPKMLFLSDEEVAPPNTSSAQCVLRAFGGVGGFLWQRREDGEYGAGGDQEGT